MMKMETKVQHESQHVNRGFHFEHMGNHLVSVPMIKFHLLSARKPINDENRPRVL